MGLLGWPRGAILGHSMGGAIGLLYSGVFTEEVSALVMLDNMGPMTFPSGQAPNILKKYVDFELNLHKKHQSHSQNQSNSHANQHSHHSNNNESTGGHKVTRGLPVTGGGTKVYESVAAAMGARLKTVSTLPGKQFLSKEAAELLVRR